jgi:hypothetical protein
MSIEDENRKTNQIIDEGLRSTGLVDRQLLASFDEAYNYDAASTMNWLIARLKILKEAVGHGRIVQVESSKRISDIKGFNVWVRERYPDIADEV